MEKRLTEAQLAEVVAEVSRLQNRRDAELNRQQVKGILQELNLSDDLLDDALAQVNRREALEVRTRRDRLIAGGVAAVLVGALAIAAMFVNNHRQAIARISTAESCVTTAQDNCSSPSAVNRSRPVYYRVTLKDAPLGQQLNLSCDWINPSGEVAHQNRWQTKVIDQQVWATYCQNKLINAGTGNWKVQMKLGDRTLSESDFTIK